MIGPWLSTRPGLRRRYRVLAIVLGQKAENYTQTWGHIGFY